MTRDSNLARVQQLEAENVALVEGLRNVTTDLADALEREAKLVAGPVFIVHFEHLTAKDEEIPDDAATTGATVIGRDNFDALMEVMRAAGWRATDITERAVTPPSEFSARAALGAQP